MFESTFADFLVQIPPIALVMFCFSGVALVFAISASVIMRRRKFKRLQAMVAASAGGSIRSVTGGSGETDPDLLPDLDDLTGPARSAGSGMFSIRLTRDNSVIDVVEVVTFVRAVADGTLIAQVGDRAYRLTEVGGDPEVDRRLATIREALGLPAAPAQPAAPSVTSTASLPVVPPAPPTGAILGGQRPGDLPRFKLPDQVEAPRRFGRVKRPNEIIPEINIAAAIEEYLQFRLAETQAFPGRFIHIRSGAKGGLAIDVDERTFEAVDEIDDAAVRAFLKQAIQEWQDRQG